MSGLDPFVLVDPDLAAAHSSWQTSMVSLVAVVSTAGVVWIQKSRASLPCQNNPRQHLLDRTIHLHAEYVGVHLRELFLPSSPAFNKIFSCLEIITGGAKSAQCSHTRSAGLVGVTGIVYRLFWL